MFEHNHEDGIDLKEPVNLRKLFDGIEFTVNISEDETNLKLDMGDNFNDEVIPVDVNDYGSLDELKVKMKDISGDGKLKKIVLREGKHSVPDEGQVLVDYVSFVENDDVPFDSTHLQGRRPVKFHLGKGEAYEGFELAVKSMGEGELSRFLIHPDLAFKAMGVPPRIPPSATLYVEIELLQIINEEVTDEKLFDKYLKSSNKSFADIYKLVKSLLAKSKLDCNNMATTIKMYRKAERLLWSCRLTSDEEEIPWKKILMKVYLNLCVYYNHESKPKLVCVFAREAFQTMPELAESNAKLFFQLGKAKFALHDLKEAEKCFKRALELMGGKEPEVERHLDMIKETKLKEIEHVDEHNDHIESDHIDENKTE